MLSADPLFRFQPGDHVCVLYRDDTALLQTLVAYIADGLRLNEKCFLVQRAGMLRRIQSALPLVGIDFHQALQRGALEIHSEESSYLAAGDFRPAEMINSLEASIVQAVKSGYAGLRCAGDLGWACAGPSRVHSNELTHYEHMVQALFPQRPAIGLCQYPATGLEDAHLTGIVDAHPSVLRGANADSSCSSLSVRHGEHTVEVVADRVHGKAPAHYVVQCNSGEICGWGSEGSVSSALDAGKSLAGVCCEQ